MSLETIIKKDRLRYRYLSKNKWELRNLKKVRPDLIHHDPEHFHNRYTVQKIMTSPAKP